MAKTLANIRSELARVTGRMLSGVATAGTTTQIDDASRLAHITEPDALNGALAHILTDAGGLGAAPEGESRRIIQFLPANDRIVVEYAFSAAVAAGDIFEVFKAPLTISDWNLCINLAIRSAWPELAEFAHLDVGAPTGADNYVLPAAAEEVTAVQVILQGAVTGWPTQTLPPSAWHTTGTPGTDLIVYLHRIPDVAHDLRVIYRARYAELSTPAAATELDPEYVLAAARGYLYQMLADYSGGQADRSALLSQMVHWQEVARTRKAELGRQQVSAPQKGKAK